MIDGAPPVKSAERTLEILELIAKHRDGVSFVELAEQLPYPKSSLHGLLQTIIAMRWLTFDPNRRLYAIGVKPWEVGQSFQRSRELVVRARPFVRAANLQLDETIQLGILDDLDVVYIDKADSSRPLRLVSHVGSRLPAYVTGIGKMLLSGRSDIELVERFSGKELTAYTPRTISSGDELIQVLKKIREEGHAVDDGEYSSGVYCVAVPIRDAEGGIVAAMSCSVPKARLELEEIQLVKVLAVLREQAENTSTALTND